LAAVIWRQTPDRLPAYDRVWKFYRALDFVQAITFATIDSGHEPFNRAASRNLAVREAQRRGFSKVIISDADCLPELEPLLQAVHEANDEAVHLPYTTCTTHMPDGTVAGTFDFTCGGTYVTTPAAWWAAGGQDEGFTGWAPEDFAFMLAHETFLGPMRRHDGVLTSLGHNLDPSRAHQETLDAGTNRYRLYEAAHHHPEMMRKLVG
jgi:hypothetical protein